MMSTPMHNSGLASVLAQAAGVTTAELAEIGGFNDRHPRMLFKGDRRLVEDVEEALRQVILDIELIAYEIKADAREGVIDHITVYHSTKELREQRPDLPARGKAKGFFAGSYRLAAHRALDLLGDGYEVVMFKP